MIGQGMESEAIRVVNALYDEMGLLDLYTYVDSSDHAGARYQINVQTTASLGMEPQQDAGIPEQSIDFETEQLTFEQVDYTISEELLARMTRPKVIDEMVDTIGGKMASIAYRPIQRNVGVGTPDVSSIKTCLEDAIIDLRPEIEEDGYRPETIVVPEDLADEIEEKGIGDFETVQSYIENDFGVEVVTDPLMSRRKEFVFADADHLGYLVRKEIREIQRGVREMTIYDECKATVVEPDAARRVQV